MNTTDARNGPGTVAQPSPPEVKSKAQDFALIRKAVSEERFLSHKSNPSESDEMIFRRYQWNAAICEHFYGPLRVLEVVLRNSFDEAIGHKLNDRNWLTKEHALLRDKECEAIKAAHDYLTERNRVITQPRVVQEMSFGFWTSLLNSRYEPLFHAIGAQVFPGMTKPQRTRGNASHRFESIRNLRNRIFHFRRIWNRANLGQDYTEILQAIGWVNVDAQRLLLPSDAESKFLAALAMRP